MIKIPRCYDSHLHLAGTGELATRLELSKLTSAQDLTPIRWNENCLRGDWILGYGLPADTWSWKDEKQTRLSTIDDWSQGRPAVLLGVDSHSAWVNTTALSILGLKAADFPNGQVDDFILNQLWKKIPAASPQQLRAQLLAAQEYLLGQGYSHVRDMTCHREQWEQMLRLEGEGNWKIYVDCAFVCLDIQDFPVILQEMKKAKKTSPRHFQVQSLKIFLDGALGSEGALLSRCYCGKTHRGQKLWDEADLQEILKKTWAEGFAVAVHTIGDAACELLANEAAKIPQLGELHIEHGELIQDATIKKLSKLKCRVHLQPSHYLSDRQFLANKIGDLQALLFPWRKLQNHQIPISFGSDSPVEPARLALTKLGVEACAQAGIPLPLGEWWNWHIHPDPSWGTHCWTEWNPETNAVHQVYIDGQPILPHINPQ